MVSQAQRRIDVLLDQIYYKKVQALHARPAMIRKLQREINNLYADIRVLKDQYRSGGR